MTTRRPSSAPAAQGDPQLAVRVVLHDIGNMLQGLSTHVELARRVPGLPPSAEERLHSIEQLVGRLGGAVRNLWVLAGPSAPVDLVTMDVKWMLDEVARAARVTLPRTPLRVHHETKAGLVYARCDPALEEAFLNLAMNAVVHNPSPEPQVWLKARTTGQGSGARVTVTIADDGPGLPGPVRRALEAGRPPPGRGVGLRAAQVLVARSGGTLRVRDRVRGHPERGVAFEVTLAAPPTTSTRARGPWPAASAGPGGAGSRPRAR